MSPKFKPNQKLPLGICPKCGQNSLVWFVGGILRKVNDNGEIVDVRVFQQNQTCTNPACDYKAQEDRRWYKALSNGRYEKELRRESASKGRHRDDH